MLKLWLHGRDACRDTVDVGYVDKVGVGSYLGPLLIPIGLAPWIYRSNVASLAGG